MEKTKDNGIGGDWFDAGIMGNCEDRSLIHGT